VDIQAESLGDSTDPRRLRRALGAFATGVTVVTVGGARPHGMTANSFTAVSLDPPLVLICVEHAGVMHERVAGSGRFAVSVLAADQEPVARHFADRSRPHGAEQFAVVDWHAGRHTGAPLITGALAHYECELWRAYEGGDHTIFVGVLVAVHSCAGSNALLFHGGTFAQTERVRQAPVVT
jgi:flavin reductase (DIM6/NTAB) family NADH-FMN oxidoreductase RutF